MKFVPLIWANLSRKKVRTTLTIGSFAVALFLFGILAATRSAFGQFEETAGADRLVVTNKVSLIQPLPIAYRDKIARVPGVMGVTHFHWFGGVYVDDKNFFAQFAVDPENQLKIYNEFSVPDAQWSAFLAERTACVVGRKLADRFGWKIGDTIPIKGTIYQGDWQFHLVGLYQGKRAQDDETQFWFRADYLEEKAEPWAKGRTGWYALRIGKTEDPVRIEKAIDGEFANSAFETRTQTEQAMAASFAKQMGNIELLIMSVGSVVFFTLLLVTGNTMAIAVRERTAEIAVLKALGYGDSFLLTFVLFESTLIAMLGASLGLVLAKVLTLSGDPTGGMLPIFYLSPQALTAGLGLGLLVGLVSGALPAYSAMRLRVVDALRRL